MSVRDVECLFCGARAGQPCVWELTGSQESHAVRAMLSTGGISAHELSAEFNERIADGRMPAMAECSLEQQQTAVVELFREGQGLIARRNARLENKEPS